MIDLDDFSNRHRDYIERDRNYVSGWRFTPRVVFCRGSGVKIYDVDGNEYYDMSSGMMTMLLGHNHPELVATLKEQADLITHESSWYTNPWIIDFAELLASTLPENLKICNFAVTGSEANEIAMRMAIAKTGKFDVLSIIRGLHGGSLAVESATTVGGPRRRGLGPLMVPAAKTSILAPFCYRCPVGREYPGCNLACLQLSKHMIEYTSTRDVAGILVESIPAAGGMIVPPENWLHNLRSMADELGALLIVDEAQMAPARTGAMWGFENFNVTPDVVTFGKAMTAGFAICGTITTKEIAEEVEGNCGLPWGGTYTGDPLPAAVALKQLQIILRDNLAERAKAIGDRLKTGLDRLKQSFQEIGDIRGLGSYYMLDFVTDPETRKPDPAFAERVRHNMLENGVATIAVKNFMRICPPLVITDSEIDDVVDRLEISLRRAREGYPKEVSYLGASSHTSSVELFAKN